MIRCLLVATVLLLTPALSDAQMRLLGVTTTGEVCLAAGTGCTDAGMLVEINTFSGATTVIGDTGLPDLTALAFDGRGQRLIAAAGIGGALYEIDQQTGAATRIVRALLADPAPPPGVIVAGALRTVTGLDFDPVSGDLFAVVSDGLTHFLVELDLTALDGSDRLAVDIIGVVGTNNFAYSGAPLGFVSNPAIAFQQTSGQLFGAGVDAGSLDIFLVTSQTTPGPVPLAIRVREPATDIASFPRSLTVHPSLARVYSTGLRQTAAGLQNVLFYFETVEGRTLGITPLDLDAQVTGLVYAAELPEEPGEPPTISSFSPAGGNAGVLVTISGSGFTADGAPNVSSVTFGPSGSEVGAFGAPIVVNDTLLRVVAPNATTGPITVTNDLGSDVSQENFVRADLAVLQRDITQGIPSQPLVAGKDTAARAFTASSLSTVADPMPVTFGSAQLTIAKPDGTTTVVPATTTTRLFTNPVDTLETTHRHNINFYFDGDELDDPGLYGFLFNVYGFDPDGVGPLLENFLVVKEVGLPRCDITTVVVLGGIEQDGAFVGPDDASMAALLKTFSEFSRTYPVRNGVSRLGQDLSAGVRFDVASSALILGSQLAFLDVTSDVLDTANRSVAPILDAYRRNNSDAPVTSMVLFGDELLGASPVTVGRAYRPGLFSMSAMTDLDARTTIAIHEVGHNHGLVWDMSPNSDSDGHTTNVFFPSGADPRDVRAIHVPGRYTLGILPLSVMAGTQDLWDFFEDVEYGHILSPPGLMLSHCSATAGPPGASSALASEALQPHFVLLWAATADGSGEVLSSYVTDTERPDTLPNPDGAHHLRFVDEAGEVLQELQFAVTFTQSGQGGATELGDRSETVTLVQPFPDRTHAVEVRRAGTTLSRIAVSPNPPQVRLLTPDGSEPMPADSPVTISWSAEDADGDALRFDVLYSADGVLWSPIAAAVETRSIDWHPQLSAGATAGSLRVVASDGFHSAQDESAPLTVAGKAPLLTLLQPRDGNAVLATESVTLDAIAFDLESGVLGGSELVWRSNRNGRLGIGGRLTLPAGSLSDGAHQITVTATDRDAMLGLGNNSVVSRHIEITVLPDSDGDGLSDSFEKRYPSQDGGDPYDAAQDFDGDGLSTTAEALYGTEPELADTDGDGVDDGAEVASGRAPTSQPPIISPIAPQTIEEGKTLTLVVEASDPDGDDLFYSVAGLPPGAEFDPYLRTLSYTPDFDVSTRAEDKVFEVKMRVADSRGDNATTAVLVTVLDSDPSVCSRLIAMLLFAIILTL